MSHQHAHFTACPPQEFDLDGGSLTGTIPTGFAQCFPELRELDLSYNRLSGPLPREIAAVQTLEQYKVEHNQLTGTLPEEYGTLGDMVSTTLAPHGEQRCSCSGCRPPPMSCCTTAARNASLATQSAPRCLRRCALLASTPSLLCPPAAAAQNWLRFSDNKLVGTVPASFAQTAPHLFQVSKTPWHPCGPYTLLTWHGHNVGS